MNGYKTYGLIVNTTSTMGVGYVISGNPIAVNWYETQPLSSFTYGNPVNVTGTLNATLYLNSAAAGTLVNVTVGVQLAYDGNVLQTIGQTTLSDVKLPGGSGSPPFYAVTVHVPVKTTYSSVPSGATLILITDFKADNTVYFLSDSTNGPSSIQVPFYIWAKAGEIDSFELPASPGELFRASAYAEVGPSSPDARLNVRWYFANGSTVEDQSAYEQQINTGSGPLSVSGVVPSGVVGMAVRLIDDGSGVDYFTDVSLSVQAAVPPVSLPTYASVNVPFQDRLQSLEITPLVNRDMNDALLIVDAVQYNPGGGSTGVNGQTLGDVPKEISVSVNASELGLTSGPYYAVNLSDASLVAGPLSVANGSLSFELPVSVPQVDYLEIAPLSLAKGIRALSLNASRTSALVGSTVSFNVVSSTPFGKATLHNATLYVNGKPTAQQSIVLNSSGTYLVYAYYNGYRSNVVSVVAYSPVTYAAAQLWWLIIVIPLALFAAGMYYEARKHKVTGEGK